MTEPSVMLVGHAMDEHSDALEAELDRRGVVRTVRVGLDLLPLAEFGWNVQSWILDGLELGDGRWGGIWRRPGEPTVSAVDEKFRQFAAAECADAMLGAIACLNIEWLTSPSDLHSAELKQRQLWLANRAGINTPQTLVTNRADRALEFLAVHERAVVKPIRYGLVSADPTAMVAWTKRATHEMLTRLEGTPVILQRFVDAEWHLRVVTVSEETYIGRLKAQELDWRSRIENHEAFEPLPKEDWRAIDRQAQELATLLRARYTSQDWILDREGTPVFLEANPNGQWLFLDHLFDGRITSRVAEALENLALKGADRGY